MSVVALVAGACDGGSTTAPEGPATVSFTSPVDTLFSIGDSAQLAVAVRNSAGNPITGAAVTYASSSDAVATVSAGGAVVARGNGTATITARSGTASGTLNVTVRQRLAAVTVTASRTRLGTGATATLTATAADARGTAIAGLPAATFTSSDSTVLRVSGAAQVTALRAGVATVTARVVSPADGTRTGTAQITVAVISPAATITMGPTSFAPAVVDIEQGGTVTFVNSSGIPHDVDFGVAALNIPVHATGQNTRTFATAGAFAFHCNLHAGMTGTVFVAPRP